MEAFIERKTDYTFRHGTLYVYDTNAPCSNLEFRFDSYVISMMEAGHKTVISENVKVEFFPDFIYIPEKNEKHFVSIPNATFNNPTKCYLLNVDPDFLESLYFELVKKNVQYQFQTQQELTHFITNNNGSVDSFRRLCKGIECSNATQLEDDVIEYMLKEFLLRLFQSDAKKLLVKNFQSSLADKAIQRALLFIKLNLAGNITIDQLTEVSGIGKTNFFKRFNNCLSMSPVTYIMKERIELSKKIILDAESLQTTAYQSGFNTYEHFYKSFKKFEGITPMNFKKKLEVNTDAA